MPGPSASTFYVTYRLDKKKRQQDVSNTECGANFEQADLPSQKEQKGAFASALVSGASGAAAGSSAGPIGTAIGAAAGIASSFFGGGGPRICVVKVLRKNLGGSQSEPNRITVESEQEARRIVRGVKEGNTQLARRSGGTYDTGEARQFNSFVELTSRPVGEVIAVVRVEPPDPVTQAATDLETATGVDLGAVASSPTFQIAGTVATILGVVAVVRSS